MKRPRTSSFVGVSLDGFLARKDGSIDWLKPFEGEEHGFTAFFASVDTLVMGRKTYDFVLSMVEPGKPWFYQGKRCVVMTHRAVEGKHGERAFEGEPARLLDQLANEGSRHVYVDGGEVIRAFLKADLLDQITLTIVPVLLGEGLPLFGKGVPEQTLLLEEVKPFPKGMVQLRYSLGPTAKG